MTEQSTKKSLLKGLQRLVLGLIIVSVSWWWLSSSAQEIFQKQQTKQQQAQQTATVDYQLPAVAYYKAKISNELSKNNEVTSLGTEMSKQNLEAVLLEGPEAGQTINLEVYLYKHMPPLTKGQTVVVRQISFPNNQKDIGYSFVDIYRLESAAYLVLIFIVLVIILAGFQGLTSFMGLSFSIVVLLWFFLPQIINGGNVYWLTSITSLVILLVSVYLAHGLNKKSIISTLSIILTISLAALFSVWAVALTKLSGFSTEEAVYLASSQWHQYLDLRGLLLAGIIIGTIGLLDDVAITQAATVEELHKANPQLTTKELFWRAMNVGKEHVVSMINTLALIYAGGALPLLILLATINTSSPLWVVLNHESVIEEIVRTVGGSLGLLLSIPITTLLAAKLIPKPFNFWLKPKLRAESVNQAAQTQTGKTTYTSVLDKLQSPTNSNQKPMW